MGSPALSPTGAAAGGAATTDSPAMVGGEEDKASPYALRLAKLQQESFARLRSPRTSRTVRLLTEREGWVASSTALLLTDWLPMHDGGGGTAGWSRDHGRGPDLSVRREPGAEPGAGRQQGQEAEPRPEREGRQAEHRRGEVRQRTEGDGNERHVSRVWLTMR